jgi:hypothetical protein
VVSGLQYDNVVVMDQTDESILFEAFDAEPN